MRPCDQHRAQVNAAALRAIIASNVHLHTASRTAQSLSAFTAVANAQAACVAGCAPSEPAAVRNLCPCLLHGMAPCIAGLTFGQKLVAALGSPVVSFTTQCAAARRRARIQSVGCTAGNRACHRGGSVHTCEQRLQTDPRPHTTRPAHPSHRDKFGDRVLQAARRLRGLAKRATAHLQS